MQAVQMLLEGCKIACNVESLDSIYVTGGYAPAGGIIGFTCRCGALTINIKDSNYTGTVKGFGNVGAVIGDVMGSNVTLNLNKVDTASATVASAGLCTNSKVPASYGKDITKLGSIAGKFEGKGYYTSTCTLKAGLEVAGKLSGTITQKDS